MLLLYIFILVMLFSSIPYIKAMTKKASNGATMRRMLEGRGVRFIPTNVFWYMGSVSGKRCDFVCIKDGRAIAVKVISFISSNVFLEFIDERHYGIKTVRKEAVDKDSLVYKTAKKRPYDFESALPREAAGLPLAKVILVTEPIPSRITLRDGTASVDVHTGDNLPEGEYYTEESFIRLFR